MRTIVASFVAGVLACAGLVALVTVVLPGTVVQAQTPATASRAPRGWGVIRGGTDNAIIFEDSAGTIRVFNVNAGYPVAIVTRTP